MKHIGYSFIALLAALVAARAQTSDLQIAFTNPLNGAVFHPPINLNVLAAESSNTIVTAEFFANGESLGVVGNYTPITTVPMPPGSIGIIIISITSTIHLDSSPDLRSYSLPWRPDPGDYTLTAKATDNHGNTAFSDPINVTVTPTPVVSVQASVSLASADGPGIFTITRTGDTNQDLSVPFFLLGNAKNGVDYADISNSVTIPAGQFSTDVTVNPLIYHPGNSKAVILQLFNYSIPGGGGPGPVPQVIMLNPPFFVGSPVAATIYIKANNRDPHKPTVRIMQPGVDQSFAAGSNIIITADAFDRDTGVSVVEFFDRTTKLGEASPVTTTLPRHHDVFSFTWSNAPTGLHFLRARATDTQGKTQLSAPRGVRVTAP